MVAIEVACRGIRGAITVDGEEDRAVDEATATLLQEMTTANGCSLEDVAVLVFTVPDDLGPVNPARAARAVGWDAVPLLMVREHGGDTRVARCLRALLLWNTAVAQRDIVHVYLRGAAPLRPDLASSEGGDRR